MSIFKKTKADFELNGNKYSADVEIHVDESEDAFDYEPGNLIATGDAEEDAAYVARFKSGELFVANVMVKATAFNAEGFDHLGAVQLRSNGMYTHDAFTKDVNETVEVHQMIANALTDLVANLKAELASAKARAAELTDLVGAE